MGAGVGLRGCSREGGALLSEPPRAQILSAPITEVLIPACLIGGNGEVGGAAVEAVGSLQAELICSCLLPQSHDRPR